eukprot:2899034-Prymnesium_polylepis.1
MSDGIARHFAIKAMELLNTPLPPHTDGKGDGKGKEGDKGKGGDKGGDKAIEGSDKDGGGAAGAHVNGTAGGRSLAGSPRLEECAQKLTFYVVFTMRRRGASRAGEGEGGRGGAGRAEVHTQACRRALQPRPAATPCSHALARCAPPLSPSRSPLILSLSSSLVVVFVRSRGSRAAFTA